MVVDKANVEEGEEVDLVNAKTATNAAKEREKLRRFLKGKKVKPDLGDDRKESNKNYEPLPSEALEFSALGLQMNPVEHESNLLHDTSISSISSEG